MKIKLNTKQWLIIIIMGIAYVSFGRLQYMVKDYYVIYKEANALTDGQMGTIMSVMSIAAVIAYFYNGFLADMIKPKTLMMFSCGMAVVMGALLLTNPGYIPCLIAFTILGLCPLWTPMSKLVADAGTEDQCNTLFAGLDFFIAAAGLIGGFIVSAAVSKGGAAAGVTAATVTYMAACALCVIALPFLVGKDTKKEKEKVKSENSFNLKNIMLLFQDPDQWLAWLAIGLGYTGYIGTTYISPLLSEAFNIPSSVIVVIDTLRGSGLGLVAPIIAGALATKFGAVRSYFLWAGMYVASIVIMLLVPWVPGTAVVAIVALFMLALAMKGRSAISNTVLTNIQTPAFLFGTSVGIETLIMTIPDTFFYSIAGNLIDANGTKGYYFVFAGCLVMALGALTCCIILDRRLKAGKTSAAFFAERAAK